jgi:hypothetical protein
VVLEDLSFGLGGGVFQLQRIEGGAPTTITLPQAHLTVGARHDRAAFEVGGGFSPSALHGSMRGGGVVGKPAPVSWGVGFEGTVGIAWFTEASIDADPTPVADVTANRPASVVQVGAVAHFDLLWGADRGP